MNDVILKITFLFYRLHSKDRKSGTLHSVLDFTTEKTEKLELFILCGSYAL